MAVVVATGGLAVTTQSASAATSYLCALADPSGLVPCSAPLAGTVHGDVVVSSNGYLFNGSANGTRGYVEVDNSGGIDTKTFPLQVSVEVMGVGVPSRTVGDYDVVRGTPSGSWKIEVNAKNNRTTAKPTCHFKGPSGKADASGGPDLSRLAGWHVITCIDDGHRVQEFVDGTLYKTITVTTGPIPNDAPLLIGAKDTTGGDQFSGYARNVTITTG